MNIINDTINKFKLYLKCFFVKIFSNYIKQSWQPISLIIILFFSFGVVFFIMGWNKKDSREKELNYLKSDEFKDSAKIIFTFVILFLFTVPLVLGCIFPNEKTNWISFFGSYLGSMLTVAFAFFSTKWQLKQSKKNDIDNAVKLDCLERLSKLRAKLIKTMDLIVRSKAQSKYNFDTYKTMTKAKTKRKALEFNKIDELQYSIRVLIEEWNLDNYVFLKKYACLSKKFTNLYRESNCFMSKIYPEIYFMLELSIVSKKNNLSLKEVKEILQKKDYVIDYLNNIQSICDEVEKSLKEIYKKEING